jgi:proline iminopeptidase
LKKLLKIIGLILIVAFSLVAGAAMFFVSAFLSDSPFILGFSALLLCFIIAGGFALLVFKKSDKKRRNRIALGFGAGSMLILSLLAAFTIFPPLEVDETDYPQANFPEGIEYWDLSTGSRIAYLRVEGQSPVMDTPVIFVHGGPGSSILTSRQTIDCISQLAGIGYTVYFYDQVGCGLSDRLTDAREYTEERQIRDLEAIRSGIAADKLILIGESRGGMFSAYYMADYPNRVEKAVFLSPGVLYPPEWEGKNPGEIIDILSEDKKREVESRYYQPRLITAILLSMVNPRAAVNFLPDEEVEPYAVPVFNTLIAGTFCRPENYRGWNSGFGFWCSAVTGHDYAELKGNPREKLKYDATPVLILRGECEYLDEEVCEQYHATFTNSTLQLIPGAGHFIPLEQPDVLISALRTFLLQEAGMKGL